MHTHTELEERVSIITGARGGIGRGIARALAGAGSDVVLQVERARDCPRASRTRAKREN